MRPWILSSLRRGPFQPKNPHENPVSHSLQGLGMGSCFKKGMIFCDGILTKIYVLFRFPVHINRLSPGERSVLSREGD